MEALRLVSSVLIISYKQKDNEFSTVILSRVSQMSHTEGRPLIYSEMMKSNELPWYKSVRRRMNLVQSVYIRLLSSPAACVAQKTSPIHVLLFYTAFMSLALKHLLAL